MAQIVLIDTGTYREGLNSIGDIVSIHEDDVLLGPSYAGFQILAVPGTAQEVAALINSKIPETKHVFRSKVAAGEWTDKPPEEKEVWNACLVNCGSRCPIKCHVVDGAIRWMSHEDDNNDEFGMHQVRPCGRGRVAKKRVYNADRLKYPMKRVGKRGEGKYERISWDEAIKTIGDKLKSTIATYGNEAIYY